MNQDPLFKEYLYPAKLKEGKTKCPCCSRVMKSFAKTLDKRLIELAWDIRIFLNKKKRERFEFCQVWEDHHKINDAQKLHYWGIIEKDGGDWVMTYKGKRFLDGKVQLPKRVWVFANRVVEEDDVYQVRVDNADPRWQECTLDYTNDYIVQDYKNIITANG